MSHCYSCNIKLTNQNTSQINHDYCQDCQDQESGELAGLAEVKEACIKSSMKLMNKRRSEALLIVEDLLPRSPRWADLHEEEDDYE
jgi:Zn-finger nucleic acid-binding protein